MARNRLTSSIYSVGRVFKLHENYKDPVQEKIKRHRKKRKKSKTNEHKSGRRPELVLPEGGLANNDQLIAKTIELMNGRCVKVNYTKDSQCDSFCLLVRVSSAGWVAILRNGGEVNSAEHHQRFGPFHEASPSLQVFRTINFSREQLLCLLGLLKKGHYPVKRHHMEGAANLKRVA